MGFYKVRIGLAEALELTDLACTVIDAWLDEADERMEAATAGGGDDGS